MTISFDQIQVAINKSGANAVHGAAIKQMSGDSESFYEMGFQPENLGDVYKVLTVAYEQMSDASRAISFAKTQAELEDFANKSKGD